MSPHGIWSWIAHTTNSKKWRLEVTADDQGLFGGFRLAIDETLFSTSQSDGSPRQGASDKCRVSCERARKKKDATHTELVGDGGRARLAAFVAEVGGRWSTDIRSTREKLVVVRSSEGVRGQTARPCVSRLSL